MSENSTYKFVILGEGRVGKTSILSQYFNKKFSEGQQSTVNPSFYEKKYTFEGKEYQLNFWDTAGQEQFNAINTIYYQNAVGALLVYDITIPETFDKVKNWVLTLKEAVGKDITFVIAGNKYDKYDKSNKELIDKCKANVDSYCRQENCSHFYTSAKTNFNLEDAFNTLITAVLKKVTKNQNEGSRRGRGRKLEIKEQEEPKDKKKCC